VKPKENGEEQHKSETKQAINEQDMIEISFGPNLNWSDPQTDRGASWETHWIGQIPSMRFQPDLLTVIYNFWEYLLGVL
jgi:hypothetical protein